MPTERSSKAATPQSLVSAAGGAIGVVWTTAMRQAMALVPQDLAWGCRARIPREPVERSARSIQTPAFLDHLLDEAGPGEGGNLEAAAPPVLRSRAGGGLTAALLRDTGT
jgi:hypothetical protein